MGAKNKQPDATSSVSAFAQIDQICDRFEAAWNAGQQPKIEDYLGEVPETLRAALETHLRPLVTELQGASQAAGDGGSLNTDKAQDRHKTRGKHDMADEFDPYHRWLGIPPNEQPPHHYRLLAITAFETDPEVISDAVDQRMAHVRTYHLGPQADLSQKLLNEIAAAKACLLDPKKKAAYDAQLRQKLAQARPSAAKAEPIPDVIKRIGNARLEQFVQHIMQSGLLTATDVSSYYQSLAPEKHPQDA